MDFSPDGTHFRYYSLDTNTLNIIMLPDMRLIATVSCDADLIGSWRSITEFIFGARRSDGQIAQIDYWNYDLELQARQDIFIDLMDGVQIYRPIMIEDDMFAALVRTGYRENSRQIWLIDAMGNTLIEITADNRYDHANLDWSEKFEMLAYQRFALSGSDAAPEIWVWNRDTSLQALVTETAAQPEWLD
jgi:hypothetical protein